MKKKKINIKFLIVVGVLVLIVTLLAIPKSTYEKWFSNEPDTIDPITSPTTYQTIFVVDEESKLVGVKVGVDAIEEDQIMQKWNLLTTNMNLIPAGYSTPITPSTMLYDYTIDGEVLTLNVSEDILKSSGKLTVDSLAWTFCDSEISEVVIKLDGAVVKDINGYSFKKISKKNGTNYTYETSYLFEAEYTTVVYHEDDVIRPVTYFYTGSETCAYFIDKLVEASKIEVDYTFEVVEDQITIQFVEDIEIDDNFKKALEDTVLMNMDVEAITVNGDSSMLYQATFGEIE